MFFQYPFNYARGWSLCRRYIECGPLSSSFIVEFVTPSDNTLNFLQMMTMKDEYLQHTEPSPSLHSVDLLKWMALALLHRIFPTTKARWVERLSIELQDSGIVFVTNIEVRSHLMGFLLIVTFVNEKGRWTGMDFLETSIIQLLDGRNGLNRNNIKWRKGEDVRHRHKAG